MILDFYFFGECNIFVCAKESSPQIIVNHSLEVGGYFLKGTKGPSLNLHSMFRSENLSQLFNLTKCLFKTCPKQIFSRF